MEGMMSAPLNVLIMKQIPNRIEFDVHQVVTAFGDESRVIHRRTPNLSRSCNQNISVAGLEMFVVMRTSHWEI